MREGDVEIGEGERLVVEVDGFEGPLDLLLELARRQKVDLAKISVLALAEQYLAFVDEVRTKRLELAADYLVVAAWLAYLKSRLLLPEPPADSDEPPAALLAAALAFRLKKLEAMRRAGEKLISGDLLGRERFARGAPERLSAVGKPRWEASLYDLLAAYAATRTRSTLARVVVRKRVVWTLAEARGALERILGHSVGWAPLEFLIGRYAPAGMERAAYVAAGLSASLEMARDGRLELRQERPFATLLVRARPERDLLG
jgi:segregation and condensation protein A